MRAAIASALEELRQEWLRSIIVGIAIVIVGWLVFYPLGIIFEMGLRAEDGSLTLAHYQSVLTEPGLVSALVNSIIISVATTALALVLALPMAWAVARTNMPGRHFVRVSVLVAFVIPNFISVIAWILLLGPNAGLINVFLRETFGIARLFNIYSMEGLVLVLTLSFYPLIFFAVTAALDNMDPSYEEAAQMVGAPAWRASMGIALPLVLPAILASSVFVFLEAMGAFGAPAAIGHGARFHTLTTKIYELFSYPPRFELAAAAAAPIIGFTILGLVMQRWVLGGRRFNVIGGKSSAARAVDIGWRRWIAFGYCMAVIFVSVVLPLIILVRTSVLSRWGLPITWQNLTLKNYAAFMDTSTIVPAALFNSTLISAVTASACVVLALIIVWIVERTRLPGRGLLTFTSTVTFAFPGVALAVGFVLGYGGPHARAVRDHLALFHCVHRAPLPVRVHVHAQQRQAIVVGDGGGGAGRGRLLVAEHRQHLGAAAQIRPCRRVDDRVRGDAAGTEHGDPALRSGHGNPSGRHLQLHRQRHLRDRSSSVGRSHPAQHRIHADIALDHRQSSDGTIRRVRRSLRDRSACGHRCFQVLRRRQ